MRLFGFNITRSTEAKASAVGGAMVLSPGQPVWSNRDYAAFAKEAYQQNPVANRCISSIAEAIASVPLGIFRGETEMTAHPLLSLFANPNPNQSYGEYVEQVVGYLLISGNSYEEGVTATGNTVRELYALRPDRMKVIAGADGVPSGYEYAVGGRRIRWDIDGDFSPVLHRKFFNPIDDFYGLSPVEPAAFSIDVHNASGAYLKALLDNSARPSGALVSASDMPLGDDQFARLKAQLEEQHQGARNAGRPMLLEGGLDWKPMGFSPTDIGMLDVKNAAARDICLAFGVPPMLIGIPGDNTYSNYQEARLAFWEDTIIPLLSRIVQGWQGWLADPMGVVIKPDLDQIPAIVEKRQTLWDMLGKSTVLTINEKREAMGYDALPDGDVLQSPVAAKEPDPIDAKALAEIAGYGKVVNIR